MTTSSATSSYAIVTPAHNEEEFIAKTIESVIGQTVRPRKWVIVNDGSTDRTREIVEKSASQHDFIQVVNIERAAGRGFGRKAVAFNRGMKELALLDYDFVGNLDADISFAPDYFSKALAEFETDPALGITGGIVYTMTKNGFATEDNTLDSVGGAVQLFRRKCLEEIGGGYLPLEYGGIDAAAEVIARMKGWKVRKLPDNRAYESRTTGTADRGILKSKFRLGQRFHALGYGAGFYVLRCFLRATDRPVLLGSIAALAGYFTGLFRGRPIVLPQEVVSFWRRERRDKLLQAISSRCSSRQASKGGKKRRDCPACLVKPPPANNYEETENTPHS